ncbi:MAG: glycerate kinase [Gammaproteobacteria bacterium]|nr:glycerate kinase [uncultured Shewanella sp.]MBU1393176.1 glycerate kinase [Gammaproteobacteria bacterium]MBU1478140.1 glycerate kinase [Gammaproteobacteria bacterium]MBU2002939.1 glycerate kinase [Gammaproteobacteria bacterium]MBU2130722.1 glycerate kinase [Gammaproteobacteria bacterium]MBU2185865.1 glycerate kinase [Gammaproteobacteria bacterium]
MKIVIAPDSFKESLSALEVANAIEQGLRQVIPDCDIVKIPVADGGEGTVQSMVDATGGSIVSLEVMGPLGHRVQAHYGILGDLSNSGSNNDSDNDSDSRSNHGSATVPNTGAIAVIEMASASGLHHVPRELRNPLLTTSYGTGELICDALNRGIKHIILGLGGSATNDGGAGMAQALDILLLDSQGKTLPSGGAALANLAQIDMTNAHPLLSQCTFEVACDVDNPLCGERGASAIFGPQKGATPAMVKQLDTALAHYADVIAQSGMSDQREHAGAGAAGGMGLGVMAFLNAKLKPGVEIVMQTVGLADKIRGADLVITGEGRIDGQTVFGKTPMGVLKQAKLQGIPTIGIAGCLGDNANAILDHGMAAIFPIIPHLSPLDDVLANAKLNLSNTARNIGAVLMLGQR